jgi:hypothetical protein
LKVSPAGSPVCTKSNSLPKLQPKHRRRHRPKLPLNSLPKLQPRLQPKLPLNSPPKLQPKHPFVPPPPPSKDDSFIMPTKDIVPPICQPPQLIPPPYSERTFDKWMDPLMSHINILYCEDPAQDVTPLLDDTQFWWPSDVDDISDEYMWGWFLFSQTHLAPKSAPYRFTISVEFNDTLPIPQGPTWRTRRTARRYATKTAIQAVSDQSPSAQPLSPSPPPVSTQAFEFLQHTSPKGPPHLPLSITRPMRILNIAVNLSAYQPPR